ncbi:N-acetylglucosamine kinase [Actinokineospora bangkokensis]|uniref:ATPase BadF/BadG/BcrA/BcrD type domain-containing protein n=1 Tax=Actinokineospora bangkokensis TaxID=1193682 RepID=A0A1Q9LCQ9_9PSEU|nr:BadF/BadG/BcrA/BcrD ATPase family protein [Actinokineospora bangkokensis]OLR89817.1 hypothetical protein BJP25_01990 [Actinokineospora bangkokensis]
MNTARRVVVGVDGGGTAVRAVAVDPSGQVVGRAAGGGVNPNSHPPEVAAARVAEAIAAALGPHTPAGCVVGMAGTAKLRADPAVAALFDRAFAGAGLTGPPLVLTDAEVAFAAGTDEPDGTVLIGGTGSIACRVEGRRRVATAGGFGWLLGDEGSAFWVGREAVRATLRALQTGAAPGPLARSVLGAAGVDDFGGLITACNARPPIALASYAPLVTAALADPVAADIVERAALALCAEAEAAWVAGPVVLAGALAHAGNPIGGRLREVLGAHRVVAAVDGALGAAWLAGLDAFGGFAHPASG